MVGSRVRVVRTGKKCGGIGRLQSHGIVHAGSESIGCLASNFSRDSVPRRAEPGEKTAHDRSKKAVG